MTEHETPEGELVAKAFGCPGCGNREMDLLDFVGPYDDIVRCLVCTTHYEPLSRTVIARPAGKNGQ